MTAMDHWASSVSAITLFTDDLTVSRAFYVLVFGRSPVYEDDASAVFDFGSTLINLLDVRHAATLIEPSVPGKRSERSRVQLTMTVVDVDAVCVALAGHGIALLNGPVDRAWGVRTACFEDPSGHKWELAQPTRGELRS